MEYSKAKYNSYHYFQLFILANYMFVTFVRYYIQTQQKLKK